MVTGSRTGGSSAKGFDETTRKMIHSIKEIVGNHSEADIFTTLKETGMDADEAVQKLIYQDTFHEVKRKRTKKKEDAIIVEPVERTKPYENISREVISRTHDNNVRRGTHNQNHFPTNAAPRNAFPKNPATGPSREFRVVRDNRSNPNATNELKHTSPHLSESNINGEVAILNKKGSLSNSQHGNRGYQYVRTQQQASGLSKGVSQNKQWKPKSNQKFIGYNPGVIGTPEKPCAPPADDSVNLESEIVKLQDKISHVSISESQNVIIADPIRVPETDRCHLTCGSFVLEFDPSMNSASGFEEACSSQELQHCDIDDSLPSLPPKASTNGAFCTETMGTFDSEVRTSGDVSPPLALMASEQQLSEDSEQKEAPRSLNSDEFAQIDLLSANSPYTAVEPKQQQDHLGLHNFSDYDPRGGYDLPYFRQAMDENMRGQGLSPQEQELNQHMFNNAPSSTMETKSRLFPSPANRRDRSRKTFVVLDMEDFSIPEGLHSFEIERKIISAIMDNGYHGYVSLMAYVGDGLEDEWQNQFLDSRIFILTYPEGYKPTGFHLMLADIIFWTMTMIAGKDAQANVLILSNKYKDMEEDKWFSSLRNLLENKRFYVALAQPKRLINLDGIDQIRKTIEEEAQKVCYVPVGGFTQAGSSEDVSENFSTIWD